MAGKRGNGEGSIFYSDRKQRWVATVSLGLDENGNRIRRTMLSKKRADAVVNLSGMREAFVLEQLAKNEPPPIVIPPAITVGVYLDDWLERQIKPKKAANTYLSYRQAVGYIKPMIGNDPLSELSPERVEWMLAELERLEIGGNRSRENAYVVLKAALKKVKVLPVNPCGAVDRPDYEAEEITPYLASEAKHLMKSSEKHRLHALLVAAVCTGARQAELFGLPWSNVDLKARTISFQQQLLEIRGQLSIAVLKTKKSRRTITIPQACADALLLHKAAMMREGFGGTDLVFVDTTGQPLRKSNFQRYAWYKIQDAAKLDRRHFHSLRHTFATLSLSAGVPVHEVAAALGHANPTTTWKTYAHLIPDSKSRVSDTIERLIG